MHEIAPVNIMLLYFNSIAIKHHKARGICGNHSHVSMEACMTSTASLFLMYLHTFACFAIIFIFTYMFTSSSVSAACVSPRRIPWSSQRKSRHHVLGWKTDTSATLSPPQSPSGQTPCTLQGHTASQCEKHD